MADQPDRNERGFWREVLGGVGKALARMIVTSLTLGLIGAAIGAIGGFVLAGGLGALIGAAIGAILLGGGWIAAYTWLLD